MKMLFSRGDRQNDIVNINLAPSPRSFFSPLPFIVSGGEEINLAISIPIACAFGARRALSILEAFLERRRLIVHP